MIINLVHLKGKASVKHLTILNKLTQKKQLKQIKKKITIGYLHLCTLFHHHRLIIKTLPKSVITNNHQQCLKVFFSSYGFPLLFIRKYFYIFPKSSTHSLLFHKYR